LRAVPCLNRRGIFLTF